MRTEVLVERVYPPAPVYRFPEPDEADRGILAAGGPVNVDSLLSAYQQGAFPWYSEGEPVLWWHPDPRFVLRLEDFRPGKSVLREIRRRGYVCTFDREFRSVIRACCEIDRPGQSGTWITPEVLTGYSDLHEAGWAHSVEVWSPEGDLAGGLYGVSLGRAFFGESMFHRSPGASKAALVCLVERLRAWNFAFIDCQDYTDHLARFGAVNIPRCRFQGILAEALAHRSYRGLWGKKKD